MTHGRIPGRDFELCLTHMPGDREVLGVLRTEVSDTRGERRPPGPGEIAVPEDGDDSGHGPLIVDALADRWAVVAREPPGRTVRAELDVLY